jgi:glycosyltransferase involved in cell wall biosynthesis
MEPPLVSVICLCYNHARFVREAVVSVVGQTYQNLQIIIADDSSTDDSASEIQRLKVEYPFLEIVLLPKNVGNCKAFNEACKLAKGEFIIDFATDDVMMPVRIEKQILCFKQCDQKVGVVFTDAMYINEEGEFLRYHFEYLFRKKLITHVPEGDVYRDVLASYFIPGPTMMFRREVLDYLNGYDEALTYEDFDFWVRSARVYQYRYIDEKLTSIRKLRESMSTGWYVPGDKQLHSTYLVCRKAQQLNQNEGDRKALIKRIRYEFRQSVLSGNYTEANLFESFLEDLNGVQVGDRILSFASRLRIPLSAFRKWYHLARYS